MSNWYRLASQPFPIAWRAALVQVPRFVPLQILRFTSPEGPQPFIFELPSRGTHRIPLYIFIPDGLSPAQAQSLPVVIDFHGGGFFLGSCLEQAPLCAKLARDLNAVVITVDYRLGPVNKFPAAIEDAEDVLSAVLDTSAKGGAELRAAIASKANEKLPEAPVDVTLSPTRIAISGASSGGNLALNLALSIAPPQEGSPWPSRIPPDFPSPIPLILLYPSLDSRLLPSERTRPPDLPVSNAFWSGVSDVLAPTYLPRDQAGHPRASPGLAELRDGGLHAQARVLLVLPELDSLAEQSEAWVRKVGEAGRGGDLRVERYKGMKHGWTQMPEGWLGEEEREQRRECLEGVVGFVRGVWEGRGMEAQD